MRKVRLHPLPTGCSPELATYVAMAVRGAVTSALDAHYKNLDSNRRGSLIGSIGKRAVGQLCSKESRERLRELLGGQD